MGIIREQNPGNRKALPIESQLNRLERIIEMSNSILKFDDIETGKREVTVRTFLEDDVNTFGNLSGDVNPLHMDDDFASKTPFGRRVVHGMFTAAIISTTHTNLTGPGFVYVGQELNFRGPVHIGDTITVTCSWQERGERDSHTGDSCYESG
jgi:acyl dehydratase